MKYIKVSEELNKRFKNNIFEREDFKKIVKEIYNTKNEKTFRNILGILKRNNIIKEVDKDKYIIATKEVYKYKENDIENKIYNLIQKEYSKINFTVWNTELLNEFTSNSIFPRDSLPILLYIFSTSLFMYVFSFFTILDSLLKF